MFCGQCGRENPKQAKFCQGCGRHVSVPQEAAEERARIEGEHLAAMAANPVPLDRCHRCSALNSLAILPFALGKEISKESDYSATGASMAASAVTLALFGVGAVATPKSKTSYRTLRLQLVLCPLCKKAFTDWAGDIKRKAYEFHPWYPGALQAGYKTVIVGKQVVR